MKLKKHIYIEHAQLNIGADSCVYCSDHISADYGLECFKCDNCDYGKKNGVCNEGGSVYNGIETASNKLIEALKNY